MIIDCTMYAYEQDALAVRLSELDRVVDRFVVVQGDHTFRGEPREIVSLSDPRMINVVVTMPSFDDPWEAERFLRDASLKEGMQRSISDDDWFIVADVDEIPHPRAIERAVSDGKSKRLHCDMREWYLNWRAPDAWQPPHQVVIGQARHYGVVGAHNVRAYGSHSNWPLAGPRGWHLSTLGDAALAHHKLGAFAHSEYSGADYRDHDRLSGHRARREDYLGRFSLERTTNMPSCAPQFSHLIGD